MSDDLPLMTGELAARLDQLDVESTESRFRGLQNAPGNPLGVEIRLLDGAGVFTSADPASPIPNLVLGLRAGDEARLEDILGPIRMGLDYMVGISPLTASEELLLALAERGLYQAHFMTVTYGFARAEWPAPAQGVRVREYHGDTIEEFADLINAIDNVPGAERALWRMLRTCEFAEWRGYVAFVNGQQAARAAMGVRGGVATLGFAYTDPAFRGRGCQTALLYRRFTDAAALGCDLVRSSSRPGTASERNQQRVGLRVAYTRAYWKPLNPKTTLKYD
ncbi:MAG: hypothetical protein ACM3JD_14785 [Rudaea sp.]